MLSHYFSNLFTVLSFLLRFAVALRLLEVTANPVIPNAAANPLITLAKSSFSSPVAGKVFSFVELTVVCFSSVLSVASVETFSGVTESSLPAFSREITLALFLLVPDLVSFPVACGAVRSSSSSSSD